MNDVFKVILNFFNNMKAWFANVEIRINSPTIIYNISKAVEEMSARYGTDVSKELKTRIKELNENSGVEKTFNRFLKTRQERQ